MRESITTNQRDHVPGTGARKNDVMTTNQLPPKDVPPRIEGMKAPEVLTTNDLVPKAERADIRVEAGPLATEAQISPVKTEPLARGPNKAEAEAAKPRARRGGRRPARGKAGVK